MDWNSIDNKKKVLYGIIILLLLLILIFGAWFAYQALKKTATPGKVPAPIINTNNTQVTPSPVINPASLDNAKTLQQQEVPVNLVATPFVERFGSYNNQDSNLNFVDLEFLMTDKMKKWVFDTYIPQLKRSMPSIDSYFAVNTKALSNSIESLNVEKGTAVVLVSAQRQEVGDNNSQLRVYYQDARVELQKIGTQWKVSGIFWQ